MCLNSISGSHTIKKHKSKNDCSGAEKFFYSIRTPQIYSTGPRIEFYDWLILAGNGRFRNKTIQVERIQSEKSMGPRTISPDAKKHDPNVLPGHGEKLG